jgi:DNA-binding MarR family transcriptional regulator
MFYTKQLQVQRRDARGVLDASSGTREGSRPPRGAVIERAGKMIEADTIDEDVSNRLGPVLAFMQALWALEHGLNAMSKQMNQRLGVTGPQRLVIRVIAQLGPMSPGELATVLHLHPASVTRLSRSLESRRMLRRRIDPRDRRRLLLDLGPAAGRVALPTPGTVEGAIREALAGASSGEISAALALIGRMVTALRKR